MEHDAQDSAHVSHPHHPTSLHYYDHARYIITHIHLNTTISCTPSYHSNRLPFSSNSLPNSNTKASWKFKGVAGEAHLLQQELEAANKNREASEAKPAAMQAAMDASWAAAKLIFSGGSQSSPSSSLSGNRGSKRSFGLMEKKLHEYEETFANAESAPRPCYRPNSISSSPTQPASSPRRHRCPRLQRTTGFCSASSTCKQPMKKPSQRPSISTLAHFPV